MSLISNLTNSVVNHAMNSFRNASRHVQMSRIHTCQTCEHFNAGRCNQCGCFLNVKTTWASEKCPIGKWGPEVDGEPQPPPPPVQSDCGCNKKNV